MKTSVAKLAFIYWSILIFLFLISDYASAEPQIDGILSPPAFAVVETDSTMSISFSLSDYKIEDGIIQFYGSIPVAIPGMPILPAVVKEFLVPEDKVIDSVELTIDECFPISFVPRRYVLKAKTPFGLEERPSEPILLTTRFPEKPYQVFEGEVLKKYRYKLCKVVFYPAQFDPKTQLTIIHSKLGIKIKLTRTEKTSYYHLHLKEEKIPFIDKAESLFGTIDPSVWEFGERKNYNSEFDSLIVSSENKLSASLASLAIRWNNALNRSEVRYGILFVSDSEKEDIQKESASKLKKLGYSKPLLVDKKLNLNDSTKATFLFNLIKEEWKKAPGIILASPGFSHFVCSIASYLDWPIYIVENEDDISKFEELLDIYNPKVIILGDVKISSLQPRSYVIGISSEEEANALLYIIQKQTGFFNKVLHPEDYLITKRVLNPPVNSLETLSSTLQTVTKNGVNYLILYSTVDISQSSIDLLRCYRVAASVNVGGVYPAKLIVNNVVKNYNPTYIALIGDGDYSEVDQFYAPDPVNEQYDPAYIPTDFFYEERNTVTYSDVNNDGRLETVIWSKASSNNVEYSWVPDSFVGRIICTSDLNFQTYIYTLNNYESGKLSFAHTNWASFFSYFSKPDGAATWDVHDRIVNKFSPYWHPIYYQTTTESQSPADYIFRAGNTYNELSSFNNIFYFNTHGACDALYVGNSYLLSSEVTKYQLNSNPAFIFVDACLTAALGNYINPTYRMSFYNSNGNLVDTEENNCFGVQWLSSGALGYLGSSMIAYLGIADIFDKMVAYEITEHPERSLSEAVAWARARFYASQIGSGSQYSSYVKKTVLEMVFFGDPLVKLNWRKNLVINGDFALGTTGWAFIPYATDSGMGAFYVEPVYFGKNSVLKIIQNPSQKLQLAQVVSVDSGKWYTLKAKVATESYNSASSQKVILHAGEYINGNLVDWFSETLQPGNLLYGVWTTLEISFYSKTTVVGVSLVSINPNDCLSSNLYVDEIELFEGGPRVIQSHTAQQISIVNSRFDSNTLGWYYYSYGSSVENFGDVSWESNLAGRFGLLKISQTASQKMACSQFVSYPEKRGVRVSMWVCTDSISVLETPKIMLLLGAYKNPENRLIANNYQSIPSGQLQPYQWTELKFVNLPKSASSGLSFIVITPSNIPSSNVYIDEVQLFCDRGAPE